MPTVKKSSPLLLPVMVNIFSTALLAQVLLPENKTKAASNCPVSG